MLYLNPTEYQITGLPNNDDWHNDVFIKFIGEWWAITWFGSVMSKKSKCFVLQGLPSGRTDKEVKDTRFDSIEEALSFFEESFHDPNDILKKQLKLDDRN